MKAEDSGKRGKVPKAVCSQCGAMIGKGASSYCSACFESVRARYEQNIKEYHNRTDELQSKLLTVEAQKEKLMELLREKELQLKEMEKAICNLNDEIGKLNVRFSS